MFLELFTRWIHSVFISSLICCNVHILAVVFCIPQSNGCFPFPPGVNQFCQDIIDMIRHCPPWCSKVLLYFKACWVFCTPFLLLVSIKHDIYSFLLSVNNAAIWLHLLLKKLVQMGHWQTHTHKVCTHYVLSTIIKLPEWFWSHMEFIIYFKNLIFFKLHNKETFFI